MSVDVAIVPVAGLGTRLLPLTRSVPKELLPLGCKPVLQHVVEELRSAGISQVVLVTGVGEESIKHHFDVDPDLERQLQTKGKDQQLSQLRELSKGIRIDFVNQSDQLGLGHAVWCARDMVNGRPFTIALGDAMFGLNNASLSKRLLRVFELTNADAVVAFETVPEDLVHRYGIAKVGALDIDQEGSFEVLDLVEKPAAKDAPSRYAIAARYVCSNQLFSILDRTTAGVGGEIQLTDALRSLILTGGRVIGVPLKRNEKRFDVGNFESYFSAFLEIACSDPLYGDNLKLQLKNFIDRKSIT